MTGFNGQTTTYTYNTTSGSAGQNALTSITFPGGTHQYFTYDSEGRLAGTSSDGGAQPQTFAYALGQVSVTDGTGDTSSLYYNEKGLVVKSVDAAGQRHAQHLRQQLQPDEGHQRRWASRRPTPTTPRAR